MRGLRDGGTCHKRLLNSKRRNLQRVLLTVRKERDTLRLLNALADRVGEVGTGTSELENNEMEL